MHPSLELRIRVLLIGRRGEGAVRAAFQVVALIGERAGQPTIARKTLERPVVGDNALGYAERASVLDATVSEVGGGVSGDGTIAEGHRAIIPNATAKVGSVVGEGTITDGHRASDKVPDATATKFGRVIGEGALADGYRATILNTTSVTVYGSVVGEGTRANGHHTTVLDATTGDG